MAVLSLPAAGTLGVLVTVVGVCVGGAVLHDGVEEEEESVKISQHCVQPIPRAPTQRPLCFP